MPRSTRLMTRSISKTAKSSSAADDHSENIRKKKVQNDSGTDELVKKSDTPKSKKQKLNNSVTTTTATTTTAERRWYEFFTNGDKEYNEYMAKEWSFEKRGDTALFEKLSLEGAQSGLSWLTILRKREAYRKAFHDFDPVKVSGMTDSDVIRLMTSEGDKRDTVVRHEGKIRAVINNAQCIVNMSKEATGQLFDEFLWSFVNDKPILNKLKPGNAPSQSVESEAMSKALKKRGFKFVGPTTCYALMQSVGMVVDHPVESPEWIAAKLRLEARPGGFQWGRNR